jgi:hypothetical protein
VLSGFRKNYLLAEKSAGDGAAAMVGLISCGDFEKNGELAVREERWWALLDG